MYWPSSADCSLLGAPRSVGTPQPVRAKFRHPRVAANTMAAIAYGSIVAPRAPPGRSRPRRAAGSPRGGAHPKSILCRASKDDEGPTRPALPRRGFLGTTAAAAFAALPWVKDIAAVAAGEPPAYPDVITMQESFWAKSTKAARTPRRWYPYWWALPLGPYGSKATAMNTVVPDEMWTFDQLQGLLDVRT